LWWRIAGFGRLQVLEERVKVGEVVRKMERRK
jgi:hypothetical protein